MISKDRIEKILDCAVTEIVSTPERFIFHCKASDDTTINLKTITQLVELFGTEKIDIETFDQRPGCASCDYGAAVLFRVVVYRGR